MKDMVLLVCVHCGETVVLWAADTAVDVKAEPENAAVFIADHLADHGFEGMQANKTTDAPFVVMADCSADLLDK